MVGWCWGGGLSVRVSLSSDYARVSLFWKINLCISALGRSSMCFCNNIPRVLSPGGLFLFLFVDRLQ